MSDVQEIKAILLGAAYEAALSALQGAVVVDDKGNPLTVAADPTVQDPGLRKKNLAIYEVAKVHYEALRVALQDQTGIWKDPVLPVAPKPAIGVTVATPGADVTGSLAGHVASVVGGVLAGAPQASPLVK